jgi:hypothetical protein
MVTCVAKSGTQKLPPKLKDCWNLLAWPFIGKLLRTWENHHCEKHGNTQISPNIMKEVGPWHAWTLFSNQTRPPIRVPGEHQVFQVPVLALIIETSAVWPWCRRSFQDICRGLDNYSWVYLWLISHDLSHGVPLVEHFLMGMHFLNFSQKNLCP